MIKVLVVTGMTASEKSKVAIELAKKFNGEIISADSVAIYKEMNIGSAKISLSEQEGVIHHLLDQLDYRQQYNVRDFQQQARQLIEEITARNRLPIVVGGTGLYIRALLYDYQFEENKELPDVSHYSTAQMIDILQKQNESALETIHPNNTKRLRRAVQLALTQHSTPQKSKVSSSDKMLYDAKVYIFSREREKLYESINQRVDQMIEKGLEQEVRSLVNTNEDWKLGSLTAIGYREFESYFNGEISFEQCIEQIKKDTRNFAKRQVTWFKHQVSGTWVDSEYLDIKKLEDEIETWLKSR